MATSPAHSLQIAARPGHAGPSKPQQRFNALIKKVAQLKKAIATWNRDLPALHTLRAEGYRRAVALVGARSELVRRLERMVDDRALTKRERNVLRRWICQTCIDLLQSGASDDLKAIYNRHSRGDYDAELATEARMQAHLAQSILEAELGMDFGDQQFTSMDDLQQAATEQIDAAERDAEQRQRAADERRAKRKKSARQVANDARRETRARQIGKTLQEIYRKLALLLHPDHERDPVERARKTQLMQEVNVAYERKDLLGLLELQLRFEQVDEAHISSIAEDRLLHFNSLLTEQVRELQRELAAIEEPWRDMLDTPPTTKLTCARIEAWLQHDMRDISETLSYIERDLEALRNPRELKRWLVHAQRAMAADDEAMMRDGFGAAFR